MKWLLRTSLLLVFPSSLRVMVWRQMRAARASGIQNGVRILPHNKEQMKFVQEIVKILEKQGGLLAKSSRQPC